jgi:hypothetical protein
MMIDILKELIEKNKVAEALTVLKKLTYSEDVIKKHFEKTALIIISNYSLYKQNLNKGIDEKKELIRIKDSILGILVDINNLNINGIIPKNNDLKTDNKSIINSKNAVIGNISAVGDVKIGDSN